MKHRIFPAFVKSQYKLNKGLYKKWIHSKAVKQFNLKMFNWKNNFSRGAQMSTDYETIRKELRRKIQSKESEMIISDEEYFYAVGQLVNYFYFRLVKQKIKTLFSKSFL